MKSLVGLSRNIPSGIFLTIPHCYSGVTPKYIFAYVVSTFVPKNACKLHHLNQDFACQRETLFSLDYKQEITYFCLNRNVFLKINEGYLFCNTPKRASFV
jgi:hypothetical protein